MKSKKNIPDIRNPFDPEGVLDEIDEEILGFQKWSDDVAKGESFVELGMNQLKSGTARNLGYARKNFEKAIRLGAVDRVFDATSSALVTEPYGNSVPFILNILELIGKINGENFATRFTKLGIMLFAGFSADPNPVLAKRVLKLASEGGDAEGSFVLAILYLTGSEDENDAAEARRLLEVALEDGYDKAEDALTMLEEGKFNNVQLKAAIASDNPGAPLEIIRSNLHHNKRTLN